MPEPLVPADVDLRDFAFMPLDVARLRDSAIVDEIDGDAFRAAILLWCASWHQVPAGSLPKDAKQLSKFAGYGRVVSEWEKVAEGALYGWVECSDGRLYHPVIAEKAIEAWEKKSEYVDRSQARTERAKAAAGAKWGEREPSNAQTRSQRLAEARERGKHSSEEWTALLGLFDHSCVRCSSKDRIVKDHITPIYRGGSDALDNLQPLCGSCNSSKGPDTTDHREAALPGWRDRLAEVLRNGAPARTPAETDETPAERLPKGNRQGQGIDRDNASAAAVPARRGSDELGGRLRPLVGSLPVVVDADLSPILRLLAEGLTMGDVEAGITVCVERSRKKPRAWGDFENWIRRAAKDRLEAEGQRPFGQRLDRPAALPDPALMRRHQVNSAASFLRGDNHPSWPRTSDPDSPDCNLSEDVIADARAIIEMERAETPHQKARRLGFVLETAH